MIRTRNENTWDENAIYAQYIKDIGRYPLLDRVSEKQLLALASRGNKEAMDKLVLSNLRFVINIAFMYKGQGLSVNELINEGNIGLIEAARRFDAAQEIKFISYAVWWIRQSITRAISEKARIVRISAEKELVLRRLNRNSTRTRQAIGGEYTLDSHELAGIFDYTPEQVDNIMKMGLRHASLDAPVGEDGDTNLMEVTADPTENQAVMLEQKSEREYLHAAIAKLSQQEREVLGYYFGIDKPYTLNLQEIGKIIGLSKERVRQVKEKALAHLKEMGIATELAAVA